MSLDELHSKHCASLQGDRQRLLAYYAKNAPLLLQYYENQGNDEQLLHDWRMNNEPGYTKVLTATNYGRCSCGGRLHGDTCSRCATVCSVFEYAEVFEQRSQTYKSGYKRTGFLAGHLAKLDLSPDLQDSLIDEFKRVERAFASVRQGARRNMLPYKMVIKKLLLRLNQPELAASISYTASYENLLQQEALWDEICTRL